MPYDSENDFNIDAFDLVDSVNDIDNSVEIFSPEHDGETQTEYDVSVYDELSRSESDSSVTYDIDYSVYLEDIISNQEIIIANQETIRHSH